MDPRSFRARRLPRTVFQIEEVIERLRGSARGCRRSSTSSPFATPTARRRSGRGSPRGVGVGEQPLDGTQQQGLLGASTFLSASGSPFALREQLAACRDRHRRRSTTCCRAPTAARYELMKRVLGSAITPRAEEPLDEPVVDRDISSGDRRRAARCAAGSRPCARSSRGGSRAVGEDQCDVRVVGARQVVPDEGAGIGIAAVADALVEADLVPRAARPAANQAARMGLQRRVGRVDADLDARTDRARHTLRAWAAARRAAASSAIASMSSST